MDALTIKRIRAQLGMTQEALAKALGVSFAAVNRWENGKSKPQRDRIERLKSLLQAEVPSPQPAKLSAQALPPRLDFEGDAEAVKLVLDAHRLQNGHLFNKAFGLELSRVVPLPHQRIAVYEHLLPQNPLRFLLADDAGAGKTIMAGLYIREMLNRGRLRRVLICCPAGLTWNWRRELAHYFDLDFRILRSSDFQRGQPLDEPGNSLFIISVDTAAADGVKQRLLSEATGKFDLIVFDEAHKLSWADPDRPKTRRYRLAEDLGARCTHLLLLTATPHMGKQFPYFALWRLLDPRVLSTLDAFISLTAEKKSKFFIRRLKEEMVDYEGQPIYNPRLCQTISYRLTDAEQHFYEAASEYLRWSYETNRRINQNAAAMVVAVLQRRLASSTYAMLESLKRRRQRIVDGVTSEPKASPERLASYFDTSTADDNASEGEGRESEETFEDQALALLCPAGTNLNKELGYLDRVITLGEQIRESLKETKFLKLRELIESAEFHNQQLLIFTEHRDTLDYLRQRFEALGYTGQVASIHGGMAVEEREEQRIFFMPPEERRKQGVGNPSAISARIMLATDAAGEGINLQFAWVMINYDIPWNPARLEQRMGRLHRFGQKHPEVRIFNLVAEGTREGDVLATLLNKLEEAKKELCTDKVFDVVGQQLIDISLRDLLRQALFESAPYSAQRKLDSMFATQRLRASVEELRKLASTYGDVARRLGQLNSERVVEEFHRLLPAFVQNFVERAAPRAGIELEGDLAETARFTVATTHSDWLRKLGDQFPQGLPDYLTVRRDFVPQGVERDRIAFLRPGDVIFDALCVETLRRYAGDSQRGAVFRDPAAEKPYCVAAYVCQMGESQLFPEVGAKSNNTLERRLIAVRWDESGEVSLCAPNYLLALQTAPHSLTWKAGTLLQNPEDHVARADAWARMFVETNHLHQLRTSLRAETETRIDDLIRGYDYGGGKLAKTRSDFARRLRQGEAGVAAELEDVKKQQAALETEKAQSLLSEQRRAELLDIVKFERLAVAIVIPDPTPEARESFDKNIETIAIRIARNFEMDHYQARVFDVSSPHLARGYDLESHRANGEKVVIEVKGRAGRGSVQLTDNEWPTAANIRDKYWLYVVVDCATEPKLFRVCDPIRLAFKTRQTITLNIGDIITEAEHD